MELQRVVFTHRISSGLKVARHLSESSSIFFDLSMFQFRASKYLLKHASVQYCKLRPVTGPIAALSSLICTRETITITNHRKSCKRDLCTFTQIYCNQSSPLSLSEMDHCPDQDGKYFGGEKCWSYCDLEKKIQLKLVISVTIKEFSQINCSST